VFQVSDGPQNKSAKAAGHDVELALIDKIRLGDKPAFEALYRLYFRKLYRFTARVLGNTGLAEDVINETMYVVWKKAASFDGSCKLSTWIFGIAFNKARKLSATPQTKDITEEELEHAELERDEHAQSCALELIENRELLEFALKSLSDTQRAVIELTYYHDFSYREIADIMQCTENTVKTRMFYARKNLYDSINQAS
jgi:RNA polymerase sigma-70 factor (ECF subfamily)